MQARALLALMLLLVVGVVLAVCQGSPERELQSPDATFDASSSAAKDAGEEESAPWPPLISKLDGEQEAHSAVGDGSKRRQVRLQTGALETRLLLAGKPMAGVVVEHFTRAFAKVPEQLGKTKTDMDGRLRIAAHRREVRLRVLDTRAPEDFRPVRTRRRGYFSSRPIRVPQPRRIMGRVTLADGRPAANAEVIEDLQGLKVPDSWRLRTRTNARGEFAFERVAPRRRKFRILCAGNWGVEVVEADTTRGDAKLVVCLQAARVVTGVVRNERQQPIPDATITAEDARKRKWQVRTHVDGTFYLQGVSGTLRLKVIAPGHFPLSKVLRKNRTYLALELPRAVTVTGTVKASPAGRPRVTVRGATPATAHDASYYRHFRSDRENGFSVRLRWAVYRVEVAVGSARKTMRLDLRSGRDQELQIKLD